MKDARITIKNGIDGHVGAKLIDCAWRFKSKIFVMKGEKRANANSLMSVLSLQLIQGDEITLIADGEDEERAIDMLTKAFNTCFLDEEIIKQIRG